MTGTVRNATTLSHLSLETIKTLFDIAASSDCTCVGSPDFKVDG